MTPSDLQAKAIRAIVEWFGNPRAPQVFYLAGFAGTGKSTVAKFAIDEIKARFRIRTVVTAAYTGKAASVLRKKGVDGAMTCHALLYIAMEDPDTGQFTFKLNSTGPAADADLIVFDEVSMIPEDMADDARTFGKKILVMGDPGQLPPVRGEGAFTNRQPDFFLTEIHRQAENSPIIRIATMARRGQDIPVGDYGDGVFVKPLNADTMHDVYRPGTQTICGVHRVRWTICQRMRRRLGFEGPVPLLGERIINCRNKKEDGIYNGQLGMMRSSARVIDPGSGAMLMDVNLEDAALPLKDMTVHPYLFDQHFSGPAQRPRIPRGWYEFDWGYALTCHKSQGSEWSDVTVVDDSKSFREDGDRWLYTALTRSSSDLVMLKRV